jgi:hypothetical protein
MMLDFEGLQTFPPLTTLRMGTVARPLLDRNGGSQLPNVETEPRRSAMANALFIGWGRTARGRERVALQVFNEAVAYFRERQEEGDFEAFEPVNLEPHGGDLYGFFLIRGDPESLARMRNSEDFNRIILRGDLVVENLGVVTASVGDEITQQFESFQEQASELTG